MARYCENCGAELSPTAKFCPECGFDLTAKTAKEPVKQPPDAASPAAAPVGRKHRSAAVIGIVLLFACVIAGICFLTVYGGELSGDDKVAFSLVRDVATQFERPATVRLVSGTVYVDPDTQQQFLFCRLEFMGNYGQTQTEYFNIGKKPGEKTLIFKTYTADISAIQDSTDSLNIRLINYKLKQALKFYAQ